MIMYRLAIFYQQMRLDHSVKNLIKETLMEEED
jgi:hypothetical protein